MNKQFSDKGRFMSDYLELTYLKLFIHDFSTIEINEFLGIDIKKSYYIRYRLFDKFNSKDWLDVINKAFKTGYLNKTDFIEDKVRTISRVYTQIIFNKYFIKKSIPTKKLKSLLLDFYETCGNKLLKEKSKKIKEALIPEEIEFIRQHHYTKMNTVEILKPPTTNFIYLKKFDQTIFYKLDVSNWFNAFRIAFQLHLLDITPYNIIQVDKEIDKAIETLKEISLLHHNHYETKNTIYSLLNKLHSNIEFTHLTSNK